MVTTAQLTVQFDALPLGELALLLLELQRHVEQPFLDPFRGHRIAQEREVVAEQQHRVGVRHPLGRAHQLFEEDRRHRRDVFVAEPHVGHHESFVARLHERHAQAAFGQVRHPMAGDHLFAQRHGAPAGGRRRERHFALQPRHVVVEQAAVFDDAPRDLAFTPGERRQRDRFAAADLVDDREVGRGQHAEVLTVLPVDALDVFGNDELDPRTHLGVRRLFTRRALAAPLAADGGDEPAGFHRAPRDRELITALQTQIGELAERLVEVVADVGGGDLVGRNVVAQLDRLRPSEVLPCQLAPDDVGVLGQEQEAAFEPHMRRQFGDWPRAERIEHARKMTRRRNASNDVLSAIFCTCGNSIWRRSFPVISAPPLA